MKINDKLEVVEADSFSTSTAYRMTLKYEGETFYYRGEMHEYGMDSYWYNSEGNKIADPDWADLIEESEDKTLFDICEEKEKENEKSFDWLCCKVLEIVPTATFERDNDGQIVIYTGLTEDSEDKTLFDICEEKIEEEKKKSGRTECGFEVEQALVKELELQGFPSDLIKQVLRTYPIDQIIFESILKEASIKIDELQKAEVK